MQVKIRPMSRSSAINATGGMLPRHAVDEQRSGRLIQVETLKQFEYDSVDNGMDPLVPVL